MSSGRYRDMASPLARLAVQQPVGKPEGDKIALLVLIALDAARRSLAPAQLANVLVEHLTTALLLWARVGNTALHRQAAMGYLAICDACKRPTDLLDLTEPEYQAIRAALNYYLAAIPKLEAGLLAATFQQAKRKLSE